MERLIDQYSAEEITRARIAGDPRWEHRALDYWSTMYTMLDAAAGMLSLYLDYEKLGDDANKLRALQCYAITIRDTVISITNRGYKLPPEVMAIAKSAERWDVRSCQF